MGMFSKWKRKIRKTKRTASKVKGWFTYDPLASSKVQRGQPKKKGAWTSQRLSSAGKYPEPTWGTLEGGQRVYGPVREGGGWAFYNEQGEKVFTKQMKARMSLDDEKPIPRPASAASRSRPTPKTRAGRKKLCGKPRADGKKCQFRGNCPHHPHTLI